MPAAASANPQWANLTADDLTSDSFDDTEDPDMHIPAPPHTMLGGALGNAPATPVTSGGGLADLLGGGAGIAPLPYGYGLQNMTPEMREIMQIALRDPLLGPQALGTLLQAGAGGMRQGMVTPAEQARLAVELSGQQQRTDVAKQRLSTYEQAQQRAGQQFQQAQQMARQRLDLQQQQQKQLQDMQQQRIDLEKQQLGLKRSEGVIAQAQKSWDTAFNGGTTARDNLDTLSQLETYNNQVQTGRFGGTTKDILNLAQSLGVNLGALGVKEGAAPYEAFDALAKHMAMTLRNPPGQANLMPGQMSNYEDQLLQSMGPQLLKTNQGNQIMIEVQKRLNQRALDFSRFAVDHQQRNNGLVTPDWFKESSDWWQDHPLMTPELRGRIDALSKVPAPAAAAPGPVAPPGLQGVAPPQATAPSGPAVIKSDDEFNALPSGSIFVGPDGKQRRKP